MIAWLVWALSALLVIAGGLALTRWIRPDWLRSTIRLLAIVTLLVPAPAGSVEGVVAPAWVVLVFEAFLQRNGDPAPALSALLLAWAAALVLLILLLGWRLRGSRR